VEKRSTIRKTAKRLLTSGHAGHQIGCSSVWAAELFDRGELRGIRDSSGRRLIEEDSISAYLTRHRQKVTSAAQ